MKYIDAENLIAEINNRLMSVNLEKLGNFGSHRIWAYNDVKDLIISLQKEQPSTPSNLDEAAETFNRKDAARMWDYEGKTNGEIVEAAFKAGAEWMEGQGVNIHGRVLPGRKGNAYIESDWFDNGYEGLSWNDEVELIIQKRQ